MSSRIIRPFVRYERQLRWLLRRLTPGQYLGLHFTVGLLVAGAFLWFFVDVAEDVVTEDPLVRFDQAVVILLRYLATPTLTPFFLIVTAAASAELLTVVGVLVTVSYALLRRWLHVVTWLAALAGGAVLNQLLKALFSRSRPSFVDPSLPVSGYSFPSGHAMLSLVVYGVLAYFVVLDLRTWRARIAVVFGTTLLVLLVGFSRMYLGAHYFSDVVAGYAAGGVWLSALITGMETVRRRKLS
jgi:membrane-associated phospholipid phosphatase